MKKKLNIRLYTQIAFFLLIGLISINHGLVESGYQIPFISKASIHALCPYGGIETFISFITNGILAKKVHESSMILMFIVLFMTILFGPVLCGWACPLGSIQEWIGYIGKKIFGKKYNKVISTKVHNVLKYVRYGVLIWTVYITTKSLKLLFVEVDPYYALFKFWTDEATVGGIIVLVLIILSSLVVERPWCKYLCPYGGFLGIFNKIRIFKITRNKTKCISCSACHKNCPMLIEVYKTQQVKDQQCISCLRCTSENSCPIENTVNLKYKKEAESNETKTYTSYNN